MTTFQYFLPREKPTNTAQLLADMRSLGLGYAVEDRLTPRTTDTGPNGQRGVVVCHGGNQDGKLGWWPDEQVWKKIPEVDVWCGMFREDRPTPQDLARTEQIAGEWLKFEDDSQWLAPKARRFVENEGQIGFAISLPQRLTLNDDGIWQTGAVKHRYERLWTMACAYVDAWSHCVERATEDKVQLVFELEDSQLLATAIAAIQTNYRIGPVELDMLGIFDQQMCWKILDVLIDAVSYNNWIKKKARELAADGGTF